MTLLLMTFVYVLIVGFNVFHLKHQTKKRRTWGIALSAIAISYGTNVYLFIRGNNFPSPSTILLKVFKPIQDLITF
jgi:hypothetical protein